MSTRVIKIGEIQETIDLTIDDIDYTIDNIDITIDQTIIEGSNSFRLVPRKKPLSEVVVLNMWNEFLEQEYTITCDYTWEDGIINIYYDFDFKDGYTYETKLFDNQDIIWRGRIYATIESDLQNFKLNK